jgi:hypothetical protein
LPRRNNENCGATADCASKIIFDFIVVKAS